MWAFLLESEEGRFFRKEMIWLRAFLCLMLVGGVLNAILPEGNARDGVRMVLGLMGIKLIAAFVRDALLNFL